MIPARWRHFVAVSDIPGSSDPANPAGNGYLHRLPPFRFGMAF
jgi:hypothetical protein